ncbi:MAG TPA: ADP-dependent glucokinase/phosphofructokinase [Propionibacteriaceae bacterium]|nr:ADP-dependent glucokinase/phosphofructokinase [Propionibacteriaceae bacterium]
MGSRVVLGLVGCVDYELQLSSSMLEQLVAEHQIRDGELTSAVPVTNERDLIISMLAYIKQDVGGERFVASSDALSTFAGRFPKRISLGGTAVRAALAMNRLGVPSTLHLASINDYIRRLLPPACDYICSAREDTLDPHLIVQYEQDIRVRVGDINLHAPFPNRLIYVNDPPNEALALSDELGSVLGDADIFLISGFNSMRDQDLLDERLITLRRHMRQLPPHALVYYEDAAFHEPGFSRRVRNALLDVIDVYGLNEDEMQAYVGHQVDLLSVTQVEHALHSLRALIPAPTLVVHTKYWSLVFGEGAREYAEAVRSGMVMASAHYCYGDDFTDHQHELIPDLPMRPGTRAFATALENRMGTVVRCFPGFTLDVDHPTTVGLGDAFVGGFLAALRQVERRASWM